MSKYRIYWDIGYGETVDYVEADSHQEAVEQAWQAAKEDFEAMADYGAEEVDEEETDR